MSTIQTYYSWVRRFLVILFYFILNNIFIYCLKIYTCIQYILFLSITLQIPPNPLGINNSSSSIIHFMFLKYNIISRIINSTLSPVRADYVKMNEGTPTGLWATTHSHIPKKSDSLSSNNHQLPQLGWAESASLSLCLIIAWLDLV